MNIPNADVSEDTNADCVTSYLICATPRTGSTLLSSMLMDTQLAGQPFEFIHELTMREFFARIGRPLGLEEYVNFLKARRSSLNGVFGFKAQYGQLSGLTQDIDVQCNFIRCFDRFVLIYRRDVLAQAISHYRAMLTGVWHESAEARLSGRGEVADEYDVTEIAKYIAFHIAHPEAWRRLLRRCGVDWLEVAYEDLARDPVGTLLRVMKHLGIDVRNLTRTPRPRLRRQSDEISREWRKRFVSDLLGEPGAHHPGGDVRAPMTRLWRGRRAPTRI